MPAIKRGLRFTSGDLRFMGSGSPFLGDGRHWIKVRGAAAKGDVALKPGTKVVLGDVTLSLEGDAPALPPPRSSRPGHTQAISQARPGRCWGEDAGPPAPARSSGWSMLAGASFMGFGHREYRVKEAGG